MFMITILAINIFFPYTFDRLHNHYNVYSISSFIHNRLMKSWLLGLQPGATFIAVYLRSSQYPHHGHVKHKHWVLFYSCPSANSKSDFLTHSNVIWGVVYALPSCWWSLPKKRYKVSMWGQEVGAVLVQVILTPFLCLWNNCWERKKNT